MNQKMRQLLMVTTVCMGLFPLSSYAVDDLVVGSDTGHGWLWDTSATKVYKVGDSIISKNGQFLGNVTSVRDHSVTAMLDGHATTYTTGGSGHVIPNTSTYTRQQIAESQAKLDGAGNASSNGTSGAGTNGGASGGNTSTGGSSGNGSGSNTGGTTGGNSGGKTGGDTSGKTGDASGKGGNSSGNGTGSSGDSAGGDEAKNTGKNDGVLGMCMADPILYHTSIFGYSFDASTAAARLISTAVKYFLSEDTDIVAELVWKKGKSCGGCGGCYGGKKTAGQGVNMKFTAILNEISVDEAAYSGANTLEKTKIVDSIGSECVANLAQQRLDDCIQQQASLSNLSDNSWVTQYDSQRRAIQAMTDALTMKRIYANLTNIATSIPNNYDDYAAAVSTVASKRLLLDQLLALKKRVVAARIRTRAQTMQLAGTDFTLVTNSPDLRKVCGIVPEGEDPEANPEGGENPGAEGGESGGPGSNENPENNDENPQS